MKERLKKIMVSEGLSPAKFAELIGVQRSSISHILSGRNKPSFDMIQSILKRFPRMNPDWILLGTGDMYRKVIQTSLFQQDTSGEYISNQPNKAADNDQVNTIKPDNNSTSESNENRVFDKRIERVLVFFNDKTFKEYLPE